MQIPYKVFLGHNGDLYGPWFTLTSTNFSDLPVIQENDVGFRRSPVHIWRSLTPPKTNMEPENGGLEDDLF